jgi:hypothetical protein
MLTVGISKGIDIDLFAVLIARLAEVEAPEDAGDADEKLK